MSFMNGPDCGPVNPLQSLLKHSEKDTSIQHDRFQQMPYNPAAGGAASMRSGPGPASNVDLDREMQQFYTSGPSGSTSHQHFQPGPSSGISHLHHQHPSPFAMDAMKRELAQFERAGSPAAAAANPEWARQFAANGGGPINAQQADAWRAAYLSSPPASAAPSQQQQQQQQHQPGGIGGSSYVQPAYQSTMSSMPAYVPMFGGLGSTGFMQPMMMPSYQSAAPSAAAAAAVDIKGKGRFVELDDKAWEAEFAKLSSQTAAAPQSSRDASSTGQEKQEQGKVAEDEEVLNDGGGADHETDEQFLQNLEHTWKNLKDTLDTSALTDQEHAAWEAQYGTNFADLHGGLDYDYDVAEGGENAFDPKAFDEWLRNATSKPYPFTEDSQNPYIDTFDPFAEGQRLLQSGHPLSEAALAFEAACKQNEHRGEAWRALGDTLAADEKEVKAIKALERAVSCPDGGGEGAWMSLAISYVNEGQDLRAFSTLEKWITTAYPNATAEYQTNPADLSANNPWAISERLVNMFLAAARAGPTARQGGPKDAPIVDADVQSGLGVLFYTSSDYGRARDCFEAALSVRPTDFLLWNRLGATLANGGQPEEAIDAYRKALELRPTFTRAIYNLGVSCLNINCFHEAAEHLLAALDLHRKDKLVGNNGNGPDGAPVDYEDGSDNIWHTLRRAFLCMDKPELADKARPGADPATFRQYGFDF